MKVVLALPPHSFADRYGRGLARAAGTLPPLGILSIAACLKRDGHDVRILDGSLRTESEFFALIRETRPDIVGISSLTFLWKRTVRILEDVKREFPHVFTVVGGPHPTSFPRQCLVDAPSLDAVVVGEGELTATELCRALSTGMPLSAVAGIAFRAAGGGVELTVPRPPLENLDTLPFPARDLVDLHEYTPAPMQYRRRPVTNIMASRGCPFRCIFCAHVTGDSIRYRSPAHVVEEIAHLVERHGVREIAFWDDTMTVDKERVAELCQLLKRRGRGVIWSAQARVNTVTAGLLREMQSAGCWRIFYGVESLFQESLDALRKGTRAEQAYDAVRWAQEAGLEVEASFIFGIPGETYGRALEGVERILKLGPDYMKCFPLTPIPGSEIFRDVQRYGRMLTEDLDLFTENRVVFVPHTMTEKELNAVLAYAYRRFYLRPSYVLKRAGRIRSLEDLRRAMRGAVAVLGM